MSWLKYFIILHYFRWWAAL